MTDTITAATLEAARAVVARHGNFKSVVILADVLSEYQPGPQHDGRVIEAAEMVIYMHRGLPTVDKLKETLK
jgi:hypothetical protein